MRFATVRAATVILVAQAMLLAAMDRASAQDAVGQAAESGPAVAEAGDASEPSTLPVIADFDPASVGWSFEACGGAPPAVIARYNVVPGEHIPGAVVEPLVDTIFDAVRGAAVFADQEAGNCIACHQVTPPPDLVAGEDAAVAARWSAQGTLGPNLDGVADRYSRGELRFILLEPERAFDDPQTVKPSYHRIVGLTNVEPACLGRPILSADAIEDVVAFLALLRK